MLLIPSLLQRPLPAVSVATILQRWGEVFSGEAEEEARTTHELAALARSERFVASYCGSTVVLRIMVCSNTRIHVYMYLELDIDDVCDAEALN